MTNVLLTGGCGFIGTHTVEYWLSQTDWDITVLDGLRHAGDASRLARIAGYDPKRVRVLWHDLRSPIPASLSCEIGKVDYLVNMASDSHVDRSISDPAPFILNNTALAVNVLDYARRAKPAKVIQVSTDEVFGPAKGGQSHKEADPLKPSNPYSASKGAQELIAMAYWRTYGVPVAITRTMNNFGRYQHPEKYVPMIVERLLAGKAIDIHAKPLVPNPDPYNPQHWLPGSRVWLHASNHASALTYILEKVDFAVYDDDTDTPTRFNIAGEIEVDNYQLGWHAAKVLDVPYHHRFVDYHSQRPGHDLRYSLDGSALAAHGWKQPTIFAESFIRTVGEIAGGRKSAWKELLGT